jgi:hypothetical protein
MSTQRIKAILVAKFSNELVDALLNAYIEVVTNYRIEKWKPSELDAGHFVEISRRIIETELFGSSKSLSESLGSFSQQVLNRYESATGDESYRILMPRVLFSIYCVRNKRGVGHISSISPNKLDATFILNSVKWVLAELVRLSGASNPDEAYEVANFILERDVDLIWDDGESFMILDKKLKADQKVLLSLYKKDRVTLEVLQTLVEYKNKTNFRKVCEKLRSEKLIDITSDQICRLSPLGIQSAESIIQNT